MSDINEFGQVANFLGRIEAGIQRVEGKVDKVDEKVDRHSEVLAEHRVRLEHVEVDIRGLHGVNAEAERHRHEERRHKAQLRWGLFAAGLTSVAGVVAGLIALLGH
jgi:hypothetical protein